MIRQRLYNTLTPLFFTATLSLFPGISTQAQAQQTPGSTQDTNPAQTVTQPQNQNQTEPASVQPQQAAEPATPDTELVIGIHHAPPFAIKNGNDWEGISVTLWREISENLDLNYRWQEVQPNQVIDQLENGSIDLAVVAIASANAEQRVDFTHSYYTTSLGIAEGRQQNFLEIAGAVFSPRFLKITLWLSVAFVVIGLLIWAFERNKNEQFDKNPLQGIWAGFWWAGVTMTTIGYGDKAPITVPGRILALLWMLVAMGITASLTASITSVLTLNLAGQGSQTLDGLWQLEVGTISDSEGAEYLQQERIQFQSFATPMEGLEAVQNGDIEVLVYGAAPLRYLNRQSLKGNLKIQATGIQARRYAFALPENDTLFDTLNQQVLREVDEPDWRDLVNRYVSDSNQSS